ncbi:SAV_2336 N-terminal domain-related protein [Actinoplanes sp. GCM10030250]|uniref:SAV_2336 N-terminal domain-related protein n=1 Tax=Actinoplanes sp. GCM10030250 TaxID=3273376 RepID=UPI00362304BB
MSTPIERLLAVLEAAGVRLTPAEVAEAIWLAMRVDVSGAIPGPEPPAERPATGPAPPGDTATERVDVRLPKPRPAEPAAEPREAPRDEPVERDPGGAAPLGLDPVPGWPLLLRSAAALPDSGRVLRALRPLKRSTRTGHRVTIDEDATARQIAERRVWTPVWRPEANRWLHLTLVLDQSSVGGVWTRLGHELRVVLERLGAFRTMRVVNLRLREDGTFGGSLSSLADRTDAQLLLVLSDCVSGPWHSGEAARLLGRWAARAPVAILQPLPERLWSRTGIDPVPGRLSAPRPGAPAANYGFVSALRRRPWPEKVFPVPVLEIEPRWLRPWANLVAGRAVGGIDAMVVPVAEDLPLTRPPELAPDLPPGELPAPGAARREAELRVSRFRGGATAPAYQLARYLSAAVPLNLAVMRVVQAVMVPDSGPSHLAEVLYSGLLEPVPMGARAGDEQHFDFRRGIRDALLGTLDHAEAGRVLAEVSSYVERHLERTGASFTAVVAAPVGSLNFPALRQPFARVRTEVLRRLAGDQETVAEPGTPSTAAGRRAPAGATARLTVLHLTGPRDTTAEIVAQCRRDGISPHLVVLTGGAAERATRTEYQAVVRQLDELRAALALPAGRIVAVPGLSDVNLALCQAHFLSQAAEGAEPIPPYWPKWEPFADFTARLPGATPFQQHQPWQLLPVPALRTVVAALNSTMAVSHREGDAYGELGHDQLRWFAGRLREYERRGWLRVGALHHDPAAGGLRDADDFALALVPHLDVVLHAHGGGVREIEYTGVPAVGAARDEGGRLQVVDLRPGTLRVLPGEQAYAYGDHWWPAAVPEPVAEPPRENRTDLVARVVQAFRARTPGVPIEEHPWPVAGGAAAGYLVITPADSGVPYRIGVFDGEPGPEIVRRFLDDVVRLGVPGRDAVLVCRTAPDDAGLLERARGQGVRLVSFADFQLGSDVLRYAQVQAAALAADTEFPAALYVPQPCVVLDPQTGEWSARQADPAIGALGRLRGWLSLPEGQMIAVAGASGTGKTFLLRELARRLHAGRDPVLPVLVDLRNLDWRVGLDELVELHLARGGIREVNLERGRYLLREGRVALLCDGLDDLAARAVHDRLRDWEAGARTGPGRGKVILVSRDADLLTDALRPYTAGDPAGVTTRWMQLVGLRPDNIREFLVRRLGDAGRAQARMELLEQVGGLMGMARNPRMLAFIAHIDEALLRSAASGGGQTTVAGLYRYLITEWLEDARGVGFGTTRLDDLAQAVTYLARRLWESGEPALGADALGAAADVLTRVAGADTPGRRETARLLGAGTLLVRDPSYRFHFVDHSILEWLVAQEIAGYLEPGRHTGRLHGLLHRELSPLMVEFLCDLAGHRLARRWAMTAVADPAVPVEVEAAARQVLKHLERNQ